MWLSILIQFFGKLCLESEAFTVHVSQKCHLIAHYYRKGRKVAARSLHWSNPWPPSLHTWDAWDRKTEDGGLLSATGKPLGSINVLRPAVAAWKVPERWQQWCKGFLSLPLSLALSLFFERGTLPFSRECKLTASGCFFSWAVVCLRVGSTFKGFGPSTIKEWHTVAGTVGEPWLQL